MLFLPLPRPLGPQTQHMVGIQEAHPLWRAVFAVTGEEEIKGRELWEAKGAGKDEVPRTSPGAEARSPSPVPQSKDVRVGVSGRQISVREGASFLALPRLP